MMLVKMTMKVALLPVMLVVGAVSVLSKVMLNLGSCLLLWYLYCCDAAMDPVLYPGID